jgi:hypothetical protein
MSKNLKMALACFFACLSLVLMALVIGDVQENIKEFIFIVAAVMSTIVLAFFRKDEV